MTKILLATLIASMLALTGVVAYNQYSVPRDTPAADQATAVETDSCPACCEKEAASAACPGCPLGEKGGCCQETAKSGCCAGDAAVNPRVTAPKAEAKKE
jgi:hypothetical protein